MKISVIVCTRNRADAVIGCLDSIADSIKAAAPVEAEIVVIDNGSRDGTSTRVLDWTKSSIIPVNLVMEPKRGISRARNCGMRAAKGEIIAYTDDDCRMDHNYIQTALRYDAADSESVVRGGKVMLGDPTDLPVSLRLGNVIERWQKDRHPSHNGNQAGAMLSANMVLRKSVAEKIGFFDENLGGGSEIPGGEETDYLFRAYFSGIMLEYVPDMIVHHFHGRKDPKIAQKLIRNYSISTGALYAKHFFKDPNLLRQIYWHIKDGFRDLRAGQNSYRPDIGFTHWQRAGYGVYGIQKYLFVILKQKLQWFLR